MRNFLTLSVLTFIMTSPASASDQFVFIGTYTRGGESRGIYTARFNSNTGELGDVQAAAETPDPTFIELHPSKPVLYAITESRNGDKTEGAVRAYATEGGKLRELNLESSGGDGLCHVNVDRSGRILVVVSYGGGQVTSFPLRPDGTVGPRASVLKTSGKLGPNAKRQDRPHPHSATFSPNDRFVYVCDLGLDLVYAYEVDAANGTLKPAGEFATPPGTGPRHCKFSADGKFLHVIGELGNTVTTYSANANTGALKVIESVPTLQAPVAESITAEIRVHPSGHFVYGSNRGHDSIAVFQREPATGKLTLLETVPSGGKHPRNFVLSPDGRWLLCANRDSDNVVVFRIDEASGRLTASGHTARIPAAVCVLFGR